MNFPGLPKESIRGVFSDFDDTMTEGSLLHHTTLKAVERLKAANYFVTVVSGRPAGWADAFIRIFPIDAMVFENGAGVLWKKNGKIVTEILAESKDLAAQKKRLEEIFQTLKKKIPHLKLATDQPYRLFDYAIDFIEEAPHLSQEELKIVLETLSTYPDITHKLSSIHVNYWCGKQTKTTACEWILKHFKSEGLSKENVIYCGDSPNDEPLFEFFTQTVGVANIQKYLSSLKAKPRFVTTEAGGRGFQQVVDYLLLKG